MRGPGGKVVRRLAVPGSVVSLVVLLALLGAAIPVQAESEGLLSLSLSTECTETMAFEAATVRAFLSVDGVGVEGARLAVRSSLGGNASDPVDLGRGHYGFTWTAPRVSRQTYAILYVYARDPSHGNATARIAFIVDPSMANRLSPTATFVLVRSSASTLRPGATIGVVVHAYTVEGYLIQGAVVRTAVSNSTLATAGTPFRKGCGYGFTVTASSTITTDTGVLIRVDVMKPGYLRGTARLGLLIVASG